MHSVLRYRRRALLVGVSFVIADLPAAAQERAAAVGPSASADSALVFEGTTLVDVRDGQLLPNRTVVVVGNRVQSVGSTKDVPIPAGARVVKATGTYMIPGLWDMHVHSWGDENTSYPLFIANGVTGVRDMSMSSLDSLRLWRHEIAAGTRAGPRILSSGPALLPPSYNKLSSGVWRGRRPWGVFPSTPAEGRRVVDSLKTAGADFIKIYDGHSRELYFAVAAEARRVGLPLAGHLPASVTAVEASDSGQRSIEHYLYCDAEAAPGDHHLKTALPEVAGMAGADIRRCRALARTFRDNDTWFSLASPWMGWSRLVLNWTDLMRYWPDSVLFWGTAAFGGGDFDSARAVTAALPREHEQRGTAKWAAEHEQGERVIGTMHRAGIRFLAGSDTGPSIGMMWAVPGFSLHNVLWNLVLDGLTPLEALQTATLNPAEYLHATDSLGTIAPGNVADLVLLDANPLADIYNTRRIRAVVANGRFFDRGDLDVLLLDAERQARRGRRSP